MNWTAEEAATATKGLFFSKWQGSKIVFDSRLIEPGDIFIALPGQSDGHLYVEKALASGASAAIVSHIPSDITNKDKLLLVDDTLAALNDLANYKRLHSKAKFIAVTGSVGKTSTKELLGLAFSAHGKTFISRGNYNNYLGVPINLASLPDDTEYAILEVGMDHAGEITPLTKMIRPHVAIITGIENIHRANFDSIEGIAAAKAEIFIGLEPNGSTIINSASNCYNFLLNKTPTQNISLGIDSKIIEYSVENQKTIAKLNILGQVITLKIDNIIGSHHIHNMMAALTCVANNGLDPAKSVKALEQFKLPRGRGLVSQINVDGKAITLIDDSYNAGPVSVKAALKNMSYYKGRKVGILGDMTEMGPESVELHMSLKQDIEANNIDQVICFGAIIDDLYNILTQNKKMGHYLDLSSLAKELKIVAIPANFLVDSTGRIVATNLRGEQLQIKLRELMQ